MSNKKILVVDDSATTRLSLAKMLSEAGYESVGAENGEQALGLVENGTFDLLMTDLNMPKMDGVQFISQVRKIAGKRFTPILILSGDSKEKRRQECVAAGASGYLQKPVRTDQLLGILKMILSH